MGIGPEGLWLYDSLDAFLHKRFGIDVYFVDATNPDNIRDIKCTSLSVCAVLIGNT